MVVCFLALWFCCVGTRSFPPTQPTFCFLSFSLLYPQPLSPLYSHTTDRLPAATAAVQPTDRLAYARAPVPHSRARRTRPPPRPTARTHLPYCLAMPAARTRLPYRLAARRRAHRTRPSTCTAYPYSQHAPTACARYTVLCTRPPAPDTSC